MGVEVSVIIPNYNHAPFLKQRITSVLSQTYQNFEVIILDDCSTDNSREIIECYNGDERIKSIVYNDVNSGSPFKQWQKGIALATGKYIWIAESDDYCEEKFLEHAINAFDDPNVSVHYCQSNHVDENNNIIKDNFWWTENITSIDWSAPFKMKGKDFVTRALLRQNVISNASAAVFVNKNIDLDEITGYKTAGDWLFWIKMLMSGDVSYSSEILNNFRSHGATTRHNTTHNKFLLRHFEILSIKYKLYHAYGKPAKKDLIEFLQTCIDISSLSDVVYFTKFCTQFKLPKSFIASFFIRKLFINKYTQGIRMNKNIQQIQKFLKLKTG